MSDIVDRLRKCVRIGLTGSEPGLNAAAADEIERLRALIPDVIEQLEALGPWSGPEADNDYDDLQAVIARLREAVQT